MIKSLTKWWRGRTLPMEDNVTVQHKARRKRALARFKVLTYSEWCKARELQPIPETLEAYGLYVDRKKQEKASLLR